ncbi:urease subunit alpha [Natrarchaeobaculum aegyptiacum]|uniref:Urease subunit alpha n=1 Tax=Natrarchaeobaculum aegyptiacum TaxID=745377 RepID=A0A2Z2HQ90_9EURY|nr:urease subunit alpha [Natrarchaeobaculum aegyptiacum]ARS88793.1 urease subunit alpha [Natrarchaeobaculum aegyptiacum]
MTRELSSDEYAGLYGPTAGDRLRLADTSLVAEIEDDRITRGDEAVFGGGKTLRDGQGLEPGLTAEDGALDWVLTNLTVLDPVLGVLKADIGIKDGFIAGVGNAGNPETMDGVDDDLIVSANTEVISAEGMIATAGGIDAHVHFNSAQLPTHAIASGVTTMLGGGVGPSTVGIITSGERNLQLMMQAADAWPINFGFYGKGNSSRPAVIHEQVEAGAIALKIHEDWGATPAVIDTCLEVADETGVQVAIHTDTLNESGFVENTFDAIDGRTIHAFHIEGAGGGHAPDVLELVGKTHMLPSSTNPSMPYTENTFDEHLDMVMVCHHLNPDVPEDVSFAESRIRAETIAAEDVLHDEGAIAMMTTDSQAMGRMGELIARTWQTADKMKRQRGPLPEDADGGNDRDGNSNDNHRIKRYLAKYTINPAITAGIDDYVGSLEPGKLADVVLWKPAFFGIKPEVVIKGGFPAYSSMGEANASLMTCEPVMQRPQYGAFGGAKHTTSLQFVSQQAYDRDVGERYGLETPTAPVADTRSITTDDFVCNTYSPSVDVDAQTFEVSIDGEPVTCDPADEIALTQRYLL